MVNVTSTLPEEVTVAGLTLKLTEGAGSLRGVSIFMESPISNASFSLLNLLLATEK